MRPFFMPMNLKRKSRRRAPFAENTTSPLEDLVRNRLSKLRGGYAEEDNGFTLIELLVVVVIIGILIAIAIPLYLNYKKGANDKAAQSDLRNAVNVLEQCNTDNGGYPSAVSGTGALTGCTGQSVKVSGGTTLTYFPASSTNLTNYIIESKNSAGSGAIYCYASAAGGSVTKSTSSTVVTAYAATCP
jgi:type IV pilus assembly protein PilA